MTKNVEIVELTSVEAQAVVGGAVMAPVRSSPLAALRQFIRLVIADFRTVFGGVRAPARPIKEAA